MHELGVVIEGVNTIEKIAIKQKLTKIDALVLQIGELSSMIPKYIEECYPAAVDGTILQDTIKPPIEEKLFLIGGLFKMDGYRYIYLNYWFSYIKIQVIEYKNSVNYN